MEANLSSENSENISFWMKKNYTPPKNFSRKNDILLFSSVDLSQSSGILFRFLREWEK